MNVDRMRHQRTKHHDIRYFTHRISRSQLESQDEFILDRTVEELQEEFRMHVARWNMWQKRSLSPITGFVNYDIEFDIQRIVFEVHRYPMFKKEHK